MWNERNVEEFELSFLYRTGKIKAQPNSYGYGERHSLSAMSMSIPEVEVEAFGMDDAFSVN